MNETETIIRELHKYEKTSEKKCRHVRWAAPSGRCKDCGLRVY